MDVLTVVNSELKTMSMLNVLPRQLPRESTDVNYVVKRLPDPQKLAMFESDKQKKSDFTKNRVTY